MTRPSSSTAGWATSVESNVLDVPAGETIDVPVYVKVPAGAKKPSTLTLTATSETDASKSASSTATVKPAR